MTTRAVHERAEALRADGIPFVHARVVLAERPTSAKPGDEALVLADGTIEGFVGGQCAQATLRSQGLAALESGATILLRISPRAGAGAVRQDRRAQPLPVRRDPGDLHGACAARPDGPRHR